MHKYKIEAQSITQQGIINLGGERGYNTGKQISLDEIIDGLDHIHRTVSQPISAYISNGIRLGRANGESYQSNEYVITLQRSPREDCITDALFESLVFEYASKLGEEFEQERMYVTYQWSTSVLKNTKNAD